MSYTNKQLVTFCDLKAKRNPRRYRRENGTINATRMAIDFIFEHAMEDESRNNPKLLRSLMTDIDNWFSQWVGRSTFFTGII